MNCRFLLAIGILLVASPSHAAPITFNTALPVSEGEIIIRPQLSASRSSGGGTELYDQKIMLAAAFGVSSELTLFAGVPYVDREQKSGPTKRTSKGLGDARLFARYEIFQRDEPAKTYRLASFVGFELPTGEDKQRDAAGLLPTNLQPGSGALDYFAGFVATYATTDFNIDGQVFWQNNGAANGMEAGDIWVGDASFQYRIWPQSLGSNSDRFLYGVMEVQARNQTKAEMAGISNPDSGGFRLTVSPGLQIAAKRWIAEASIGIPAVQNLNGVQLEQDYQIRAGMRFNF